MVSVYYNEKWYMRINYISFSECGRRRENQDFLRILKLDENLILFVLADGMGGHHNGAQSSRIVCDSFCDYWQKHLKNGFHENFIAEASLQTLDNLKKEANKKKGIQMGSMLVGVFIDGIQAYIFHCGDSRCYLFRKEKGCIFQTIDHVDFSMGWEVFERCFITDKPQKAVPEIIGFELKESDRLFLCTDGVHKRIPSLKLEKALQADKSLDSVINDIQRLCEDYSDDNYSGILIEIK